MSDTKHATLYRMVTDEHICPYGVKSKWLLEREGYEVEDHHLESREETDAFKAEHGVVRKHQSDNNIGLGAPGQQPGAARSAREARARLHPLLDARRHRPERRPGGDGREPGQAAGAAGRLQRRV